MNILMITGDKSFGPGNERYELQRSAVSELAVVYWGRGSLWPAIPAGHFDVVTAQDPFWRGLFGWFIARRLGARFNVQVHTDLSAQPLLRHVLAQIVLRHADSVRVVSEKVRAQVAHIDIKAPVQVLSIFVDISRFKNLPRIPHSQKTILWIGRFETEKNPEAAIEVLKKVREGGVDAKLVLLGKGSLETSLHANIRGLPVEFPGWQDPILYLPQTDVVLSTSRHESWGASVVEALAAGVPVVAPDVGVAREAGAIVVPREKLAEAVIQTLHSGVPGTLKITISTKEEWTQRWKETL